ncbi:MAG TPA: DUF1737 domain-containing protein [Candidatus Sulfotelmatobacter sp.]|jgi:hypothetical protein|nr:DUF1737 domain-containing protein [Candidatus Sulfotelmatobacter sp.]
MKKIIEYTIVKGVNGAEKIFNDEVNHLIQKGFQPLGGVAISLNDGTLMFAQAMVKYED